MEFKRSTNFRHVYAGNVPRPARGREPSVSLSCTCARITEHKMWNDKQRHAGNTNGLISSVFCQTGFRFGSFLKRQTRPFSCCIFVLYGTGFRYVRAKRSSAHSYRYRTANKTNIIIVRAIGAPAGWLVACRSAPQRRTIAVILTPMFHTIRAERFRLAVFEFEAIKRSREIQ